MSTRKPHFSWGMSASIVCVIILTLSPVIARIWRPQFTFSASFQNYQAQGELDLSPISLNRPIFAARWQNFITLPRGFTLMPSLSFTSRGDMGNMRLNSSTFAMELSVRKAFLKDRLTLTLNASNPFKWADTDVTVYGARQLRTDKHSPRSFYAYIVYRFNAAPSKYKGTGAGEAQKARMKN